jgi:predicted Zn-dependent protease
MVRQKRNSQALDSLAAAARLDPENPRYSYVYAVALNDFGQTSGAIETLKRNILMHPYDRDSLAALVSICKQAGRSAEALTYTRRLDQLQ